MPGILAASLIGVTHVRFPQMTQTSFEERRHRIAERHRRLALGVTYRVGPDGLVTALPRRRLRPRFPLRAFAALLLLAFGFKVLLFAGLGEAAYEARRAALAQGSLGERAVAWVLRPEAATRAAAALALGLAPR